MAAKIRKISNYPQPLRTTELWSLDTDTGISTVISDIELKLAKYELNITGSYIWQLCDGNHSPEEIARAIYAEAQDSKLPYHIIHDDVLAYLKQLRDIGLILWPEEKSVDVLFIAPPSSSLYSAKAIKTPEFSAPPLGLCYMAATLREHGFKVAILDMHQNASLPEDIVGTCRKYSPKIVAITSTTPTYYNALKIAKFVKTWNDKVVTIVGGAHPMGLPDECARSVYFDYVCIGEGEKSMLELTEALFWGKKDPKNVPGFAYLDPNNDVCYTGIRKRIVNLDTLPYPARDLIDIDSYYQKGSIISSRGCPFDCNYCACSIISGRSYRMHSVDYVLTEIQAMMSTYGIGFFDFHDDNFNLHQKRALKFCHTIIERKMQIRWGCFCRAAQFTPQLARAMVDSGCNVVQFGIESGNQKILDAIKKGTTLEQIKNAVKVASLAGIEQIVCGFIIGHADDTEKSIEDTIHLGEYLAKLGATRLTLSLLTPYPGTEVFEKMDQLGIKLLTTDWEKYIFSRVVIETKYLDKDRLRELYTQGIIRYLKVTKK